MSSPVAVSIVGTALFLALLGIIFLIILRKRKTAALYKGRKTSTPKPDHQLIDFSVPIPKKLTYVSGIEGEDPSVNEAVGTLEEYIDPTLYRRDLSDSRETSFGSLPGCLCFSVHYETDTERLMVNVIRGERIRARRASTPTPTPYVKVCLLPDKRKKLQTKSRQKTPHPLFNEEFIFHCPTSELSQRTLKFTVCDFDRFSRQNVIGSVVFSLEDHYDEIMSKDGAMMETWRDIVEESDGECCNTSTTSGSLSFSLQYLPTAKRLAIVISKGKGFELDGSGKSLALYVKITMLIGGKTVRNRKTKKKTDVTEELIFNESFHFDIPDDTMGATCFMLSVINHKILIGRVVTGPFLYATGTGLDHWNDMMSSPRSAVSMCHTLF